MGKWGSRIQALIRRISKGSNHHEAAHTPVVAGDRQASDTAEVRQNNKQATSETPECDSESNPALGDLTV